VRLPLPSHPETGSKHAIEIPWTISDDRCAKRGARGLSKANFVPSLIDKGMLEAKQRPELRSAIERIRALGTGTAEGKL
jgi:hypothetical protein